MADGILCVYCGCQESDHNVDLNFVKLIADELFPGREKTLRVCREETGFVSEDPDLAEKLAKEHAEDVRNQRRGVMLGSDEYD